MKEHYCMLNTTDMCVPKCWTYVGAALLHRWPAGRAAGGPAKGLARRAGRPAYKNYAHARNNYAPRSAIQCMHAVESANQGFKEWAALTHQRGGKLAPALYAQHFF